MGFTAVQRSQQNWQVSLERRATEYCLTTVISNCISTTITLPVTFLKNKNHFHE